jgi:ferrous iron transport protein A
VAIKSESNACPKVPPLPLPGNDSVPLSTLHTGEQGFVATMAGGRGLLCRMTSLGFTPGAEVTVVQNYGRGPLIARVRDARIALGRGEAGKIYVRRSSNE